MTCSRDALADEQLRHLLAKSRRCGLDWLQGFVKDWKRWPGSALRTDFLAQWKAGNQGRAGEWVETGPAGDA